MGNARWNASKVASATCDLAVVGLRANLRASSDAVNARDLRLPALMATSTALRQARYPVLLAEDPKTYFPGLRPFAVLGVRTVSATRKRIPACSLGSGFGLPKKGGKPVEHRKVLGGVFEMVLEGGAWKLDTATADPAVSCASVALPGSPG